MKYLLLVLTLIINEKAYTQRQKSVNLKVPLITQYLPQGCWAASSQMVYNYKNSINPIEQCQIYTDCWNNGNTCCLTNNTIDSKCNTTLRLAALKTKFWDSKRYNTTIRKGIEWNWDSVRNHINIKKFPFLITLGASTTNADHMVVGYGYSAKATNNFIHIRDPLSKNNIISTIRHFGRDKEETSMSKHIVQYLSFNPKIVPILLSTTIDTTKKNTKFSVFIAKIKDIFKCKNEQDDKLFGNLTELEIKDKSKYEITPICTMELKANNNLVNYCPDVLNISSLKNRKMATRYEKTNEIWEPMLVFENVLNPFDYLKNQEKFDKYKLSNSKKDDNSFILPYKIVTFSQSIFEYYLFKIDNENYYIPLNDDKSIKNKTVLSEDEMVEIIKKYY